MNNITIAFTGLPSAGKSMLINSLCNNHIRKTGVCRTTILPCYIFNENNKNDIEIATNKYNDQIEIKILKKKIYDDSGIELNIIDLPGIADAEDKTKDMDEFTYKHILNADIVFFVSDINKSFVTEHEKKEYESIKSMIDEYNIAYGCNVKLRIILSKCEIEIDKKDDQKNIKVILKTTSKKVLSDSEDSESELDAEEDTTILDIVNNIKKWYTDDIYYFNSFGRILFNKKKSSKLIEILNNKNTTSFDVNTIFDISKDKRIRDKDTLIKNKFTALYLHDKSVNDKEIVIKNIIKDIFRIDNLDYLSDTFALFLAGMNVDKYMDEIGIDTKQLKNVQNKWTSPFYVGSDVIIPIIFDIFNDVCRLNMYEDLFKNRTYLGGEHIENVTYLFCSLTNFGGKIIRTGADCLFGINLFSYLLDRGDYDIYDSICKIDTSSKKMAHETYRSFFWYEPVDPVCNGAINTLDVHMIVKKHRTVIDTGYTLDEKNYITTNVISKFMAVDMMEDRKSTSYLCLYMPVNVGKYINK